MSILEVAGSGIEYDTTGSGAVVVQAHGMTSSREQDRALGLDFSPVAATHTLVRYDARGHGASTGRPEPTDYTWAHLADDLLALKHVVSPDAPIDVIGASMGCGTALHAAVRAPEAFRRLVLVIPPTAWATRAAQGATYAGAADLIEQRGISAFLAMVETGPEPPVQEENDGVSMAPRVGEALLPSVLRGAALTDLPDATALSALEHPTLILPWAGDPGHPESTAEALAELLPNASVELATTFAQVRGWGELAARFLDS